MIDKIAPFSPESTLHVYNRANGSETIFRSKENYRFFLERYKLYFSSFADTFCYCLMPNHFHFLVRIKDEQALKQIQTGFENLSGFEIESKISKAWSNMLNSYTKAFNKQQDRQGALFMRPTKRKRLDTSDYLIQVIRYIHLNPVEAELCQKPEEWVFSSYNAFFNKKPSLIQRAEIIRLFGDLENFKYCHLKPPTMEIHDISK